MSSKNICQPKISFKNKTYISRVVIIFRINPLMPSGNKKVTHTYTKFKYV